MDKKVTDDTRELEDLAKEFKAKKEELKEIRIQHTRGGIRGRWMVNALSFIIGIMAIVIVFITTVTASYYYNNLRENLMGRATQSAVFINTYLNSSYEQFQSAAQSFVTDYEDKDKVEVQIISSNGRIQFSSSSFSQTGSLPGTADVDQCLEKQDVAISSGRDSRSGERVMSVSCPLYDSNENLIGAVRYISALEAVERQIIMIVMVCVLAALIMILVVALSNRYFIASIIEPVKKINLAAKEIAEGRYGMILHKEHDDEIGELCDTINHMSSEISRAERMKNDFISSVSHELRTPLTAIGGWTETLIRSGASDPEEVMLGLGIIQKESHRLTQMVEELLDFTRLESGRLKLNIEEIDIGVELYEAVYMYKNMLEREQIDLIYDIPDDMFMVNGDSHRLRQVFLNILDNAAKYGKDGGKIEIDLSADSYTVQIDIRDWGQGIPEDELPFVKEKFYKGSSKQRGSGIGLAVTDEIIRMHGGMLNIASKVGEGTCVTISLPLLTPGMRETEDTQV